MGLGDYAPEYQYREALGDAISVIHGLAGQQAMKDDWYEPILARLEEIYEADL